MSNPIKLLQLAKGEVGYKESYSNGHWTNHEKYAAEVPGLAWVSTGGQPWCATFVSWLALKAGVADLYPCTASTDVGASWFKQKGQWSEYPSVGDQVFYGHNGDMSHTGVVVDFDATYIYTIEGNTNTDGSAEGDGVYRKTRARRDDFVQGYGRPAFTEAVKSADPQYKAPAGSVKPSQPKGGTRVQRIRQALSNALSLMKGTSPKRTRVQAQIKPVEKTLDKLPKK